MGVYFTNQTIEAFNQINEQGVLTGKEVFVWEDFLPSYKWMIKQMDRKINNDGSFPIWLWTKKPNLNDEGHFSKRTDAVCLTVEVPDNKVLLSDFDAWHCVLNDWFCPITDEEDELFEQGKLNITKEQSWERIFDLQKILRSEMWNGNSQIVQGVTAVIHKEQILKFEHFTAK
ncbi:DUF3841 domain-containing protein [Lysinibacillus sp. NPDC058147]|uniref:DUF3841 domain-containing protein n=1 Tax=unclassified Lysinibacillus TaxID=2636778 RepID=UPI0036D86DE6